MAPAPTDTSAGAACLTPAAVNAVLDEALDESFPASDPPAVVRSAPALCADEAAAKAARNRKAHESETLDEALDESFPASDPPEVVQPHRTKKGG